MTGREKKNKTPAREVIVGSNLYVGVGRGRTVRVLVGRREV